MRRNISISNDDINKILDTMPKGLRSAYIEECIKFKQNFDKKQYVEKEQIEDLVKNIIQYMALNGDVTLNTNQHNNKRTIDTTLKQSISSILNI